MLALTAVTKSARLAMMLPIRYNNFFIVQMPPELSFSVGMFIIKHFFSEMSENVVNCKFFVENCMLGGKAFVSYCGL